MALSAKARKRLEVALARRAEAQEIADAIDAGSNAQADNVADLSIAAVGTTDGSGGAGDAALAADVDSRFNDVEAKINDLLAKMQAAGQMA